MISHGVDYSSALATEEVSQIADPDEQRVFQGVWTFNLSLVSILEEWLSRTVDVAPLGVTEKHINYERLIQLMSNNMSRMMNRMAALPPADTVVKQELATSVANDLTPGIQQPK